MKAVYVAHPFSGKRENVQNVQRIILELLRMYPGVTYYSPLHATGFFYFEVSYEDGMAHCLEMLKRCDELWLCEGWEQSRGCNIEVEYAKKHGKPIKKIKSDFVIEE